MADSRLTMFESTGRRLLGAVAGLLIVVGTNPVQADDVEQRAVLGEMREQIRRVRRSGEHADPAMGLNPQLAG